MNSEWKNVNAEVGLQLQTEWRRQQIDEFAVKLELNGSELDPLLLAVLTDASGSQAARPATQTTDAVNTLGERLLTTHNGSGGFRGGQAGSPILGDGLTPSLTVLLICDNGTILWRQQTSSC